MKEQKWRPQEALLPQGDHGNAVTLRVSKDTILPKANLQKENPVLRGKHGPCFSSLCGWLLSTVPLSCLRTRGDNFQLHAFRLRGWVAGTTPAGIEFRGDSHLPSHTH